MTAYALVVLAHWPQLVAVIWGLAAGLVGYALITASGRNEMEGNGYVVADKQRNAIFGIGETEVELGRTSLMR